MKRMTTTLFFSALTVGALFFVLTPSLFQTRFVQNVLSHSQFASVFFVESVKPEAMRQKVALANVNPNSRKLRILVVPGHDSEYWGTQFLGLKEATITLELGKKLAQFLSMDGEFEVILARDDSGYNPLLASYFTTREESILDFAHGKKKIMSSLILDGKVEAKTDGVYHNNAPSPVVVRLYGINKWANENDIDLVVHVHFNDYPRSGRSTAGKYSGFAIYVPEHQYSNARASKEVAEAVSLQLKRFYPESDMPKEKDGVVEDQDLIAIGSFNTLDPASLLIEYGYIYELPFLNKTIRSATIEDLAMQTYIGVHSFFNKGKASIAGRFDSTLLPYAWNKTLAVGTYNDPAVLSLQAALVLEGVYPPEGFDAHRCPMSGSFGTCTKSALIAFQKKHALNDTRGVLGTVTRGKLNELYGKQ